jgi:hypothetical protein
MARDKISTSKSYEDFRIWAAKSRTEQLVSTLWESFVPVLKENALEVRKLWLSYTNSKAADESDVQAELIKNVLLMTSNDPSTEDTELLDQLISGGLNIRQLEQTGRWPSSIVNKHTGFTTEILDLNNPFLNYVSAEEEPLLVSKELEKQIEKGHMRYATECEIRSGISMVRLAAIPKKPKADGSVGYLTFSDMLIGVSQSVAT